MIYAGKMKIIQECDLRPGLYIVATPIGNLRDITLRALDTLAAADLVLCEDSRVSGKLMQAYDLKKKLVVYNDHSAAPQRDKVISAIEGGQVVALISDAGMPLVSDPGYKLVKLCQEKGLYVTSVPGANAPLAALQLSGLPSDKFSFLGFMPSKSAARQKALRQWKDASGTLILFETGPRLRESLADMREVLGEREAAVVREITKMHEEVRRGRFSDLIAFYDETGAPKGEIVVVIEAPSFAAWGEDELRAAMAEALDTMHLKEAAAFVAEKSGVPKKELYALGLEIKK